MTSKCDDAFDLLKASFACMLCEPPKLASKEAF